MTGSKAKYLCRYFKSELVNKIMRIRAYFIFLFFIILIAGCNNKKQETQKPEFDQPNLSAEKNISNMVQPQYFPRNYGQDYRKAYSKNDISNKSNYTYARAGNGQKNENLQTCGNSWEFFNSSPMNMDDFIGIVPLGNPNPPHVLPTDHIYFYIRRNGTASEKGALPAAAEVPVFSPGDVTIKQIDVAHYLSSDKKGFMPHNDYSVYFSPCNEFEVIFGHVASISEKIKTQFSESANSCYYINTGDTTIKNCRNPANIKLKAGELIGTVGGPDGSNDLDFFATDNRVTPPVYANPSRRSGKLYTVCGLDYFIPVLREKLKSRLGAYDGKTMRTIEPVCGEIAEDKINTAQGNWFIHGTESYMENLQLALIHDNINPLIEVFSAGTSMEKNGLMSDVYYFDPAKFGFINRDFGEVTADGNIYCYDVRKRWPLKNDHNILLVQLMDNKTLRIEKSALDSCGSGSWAFGSNYADFER